jgi:rhodanese-related sulfurtransferase
MMLYTRIHILVLIGLSLCTSWPGLSAYAAEPPAPVQALVEKIKPQITTIDMTRFKTIVDNKDYDWIVDVREPNEYNKGHIPQAVNIPRGVIEIQIWALTGYPEKMDTGIKLYLYCGSGIRCMLATKSLQDLGFTHVTAVNMKLADWIAAGYPVTEAELDF